MASKVNFLLRSYFILTLSIITTLACAQKLGKEQVVSDLDQLKNGIQKFNPALSIYNPDFEAGYNKIIGEVREDSLSMLKVHALVSQLCALSNEGHFSIGTWSDTVHSGFLQNRYRYMPISVKIVSGKIYLWIDNSMEKLMEKGDEILEINGRSSKIILSVLYAAYPTDGNITTYTDRKIEQGFSWMYFFYVEQPEEFNLMIKTSSGEEKEISISALTRDDQFANYAKYYPERNQKKEERTTFYDLVYEGETAYLTLPSFDYRQVNKYEVKAKSMYSDLFKEFKEKQIQNLVVDLRGNTGGRNEFADEMVPFLLKNSSEQSFLKETISWDGDRKTYKTPKSSKYAFSGEIYVLVDGTTYSAGNTLARYLVEFGRAHSIGEESGTRYEGFAAGSSEYITLNHSQLEIGIPRYHIIFPPSKIQNTNNRGLLPKTQIRYQLKDLMEKSDLHMESVKALISDSTD